MKKSLKFCVLSIFVIIFSVSQAQHSQTIRGRVIDADSKQSLPGANIILLNTSPLIGTSSDMDGNFEIKNVKIGRYNIQVSFLGYQTATLREIMLSSGKECVLNVEIKENIVTTKEVEIKADKDKKNTLNSMASISARTFSVDETKRFAGSVDDPLRAASNFAGVMANPSVEKNEIIIRGNSPKGLLWRLDGADIPNPNHFGRIGSSGGGITVFSTQVLANSDFYTSAFPAEYGNALSGVFDMKFRNGNQYKREYAFQIGIMGIDFSAEGPFKKGKQASYLFNYRYSTIGLLRNLITEWKDKLPTYQDLSFKINIPMKKSGLLTITGISGIGLSKYEPEKDSLKWESNGDRNKNELNSYMGALSVSHTYFLSNKTYLKNALAISANKVLYNNEFYNSDYSLSPNFSSNYLNSKFSYNILLNHKFNNRHSNRTGIIYNQYFYDLNMKAIDNETGIYSQFVDDKGNSGLLQAYTQSRYDFNEHFTLNAGLHMQYFLLNSNIYLEPRASLKWNFLAVHSLTFGYGNHSQMENLSVYLAKNPTNMMATANNKDLGFGKANHFVLAYDWSINQNIRLKVESYYQQLYHIPVVANSYYSLLNETEQYFSDSLQNKGKGINRGVDITFEKFLSNNLYYLITASIFESKYKGGDGIERNTRFNSNYVFNVLLGKEFTIKDRNIFGINLKTTYSGGEYYTPVNLSQSIAQNRKILDLNQIYTQKFDDFFYIDITLNYKVNHKKYSGSWSIQIKNLLDKKQPLGYVYNSFTKSVELQESIGMLPMLSYKIEF